MAAVSRVKGHTDILLLYSITGIGSGAAGVPMMGLITSWFGRTVRGAIYFLFGYTYVIYTTFIVTSLIKERGFPEGVAGGFWAWVGLLSIFSGPVFGALSDRVERRAGLVAVFSIQTAAHLLAASNLPGMFIHLSIFFFGISAWSIPSIMIAAVSWHVGAGQAYAALGFATFIFGIGQIIGPSVAGSLRKRPAVFPLRL